jgi:hypothetical protein
LSNVAIAPDYGAVAASGSGFSGAYAKKISDGVVRTVAENFANNQYGAIGYVGMHGDREVIFSGNGFYRGDAEGAAAPTLITSAIGGTITDIDGDFAGVMGFQSGYRVWKLNLLNGSFQTIVQQGDPRPRGGIFFVVQRPGISPKSVNASDVSQTKLRSGTAVNSGTFRNDINANGALNSSDVALVKSRSGNAIP